MKRKTSSLATRRGSVSEKAALKYRVAVRRNVLGREKRGVERWVAGVAGRGGKKVRGRWGAWREKERGSGERCIGRVGKEREKECREGPRGSVARKRARVVKGGREHGEGEGGR